ncbi:DUF6843 domain-containing protein [Psychrobacillus lasiicapitis]|uniref:DUF6843 domain-containing protein n=1 Tax=Psychrobacillus lasiicapitis TaxID=1636719 RepID=A0A544TI13_9BACI|nr:hypothetical protein [Psychrobacillus lasiicapitis]TQR17092.1 hypothetical protein FG382_02800 [Psychrobacillus lasiicapitis]GGA24574.1 hypothetical protein GCM10011384_12180 [Psychrobacillus lasiicapitis]
MVGIVWWISKPNTETTIVYHLLEGFKGCINVNFNQPNEKELEIVNDTLLFVVSEHGDILTSSPYTFITDLGWHKEKAYYVDKDGKPINEINITEFPIGGYTSNGNLLSERMTRTFDPNQEQCY